LVENGPDVSIEVDAIICTEYEVSCDTTAEQKCYINASFNTIQFTINVSTL